MNVIGVQFAHGNDRLRLGDDQLPGSRCGLVEVVLGPAVDEVACGIGLPGTNQRHIRGQGRLEHVFDAVDGAGVASLRQRRAGRGRRIESAQAGPSRADRLGQAALGQQFYLDLPRLIRLNGFAIAGVIGTDRLGDLPVAQHSSAPEAGFADVVGDHRQVADVGFGDRVQQVNRRTGHAESANDQYVTGLDLAGSLCCR